MRALCPWTTACCCVRSIRTRSSITTQVRWYNLSSKQNVGKVGEILLLHVLTFFVKYHKRFSRNFADCPMGTEWSADARGCVTCPQGFYKDDERRFCQPCPDGFVTMSSGSKSLRDCSMPLGSPPTFALSGRKSGTGELTYAIKNYFYNSEKKKHLTLEGPQLIYYVNYRTIRTIICESAVYCVHYMYRYFIIDLFRGLWCRLRARHTQHHMRGV